MTALTASPRPARTNGGTLTRFPATASGRWRSSGSSGFPCRRYYNEAFERFKKSGEIPPFAHDFPGYSLSVYHRGKRVYNAFHEFPSGAFKTSFDEPFIEIGKTEFAFKNGKFEIEIDTVFKNDARGFKG